VSAQLLQTTSLHSHRKTLDKDVSTGAEQLLLYKLSALEAKKVAVVANHTSLINGVHLVDTLLNSGIQIEKVFAPEHGFRGTADAGATISSGVDKETGLRVISLYGKNKKPTPAQLKGIDVVLFDIQDVGVRYYTYISTMHYVMEACAENGIECWILDRPNPNGFYVDGPILKKEFQSFVGMHPIPLVHGLTVGELAKMIVGEGWMNTESTLNLTVIPCEGYEHDDLFQLEVNPSPNLPNMTSIYLYPSLGLFEGTPISVGRGTNFPFQVLGHPQFRRGYFEFVPTSREGARNPKLRGMNCKGFDLRTMNEEFVTDFKGIYLKWMLIFYEDWKKNQTKPYFNSNGFFDLLAGTDQLRLAIEAGESEAEIKATWSIELGNYLEVRKKYLLYNDFGYTKN
jgi:uncharacterized protein YbbC (DUF1343 family)